MSKIMMVVLVSGAIFSACAWAVTPPRPINSGNQQHADQSNDQNPDGGRMMISNEMSQSKGHSDHANKQSNSPKTKAAKQHNHPSSSQAQQSQVVTTQHPVATFKIRSNPSTGFTWHVKSFNHDLLKIQSHKMERPDKDKQRMGAPGYEVWQFKAKKPAFRAPHAIPIQLIYARPWMVNSQSSKTKTLYVVTH